MKNNYQQQKGNELLGRLLKLSAIGILILVWILIDKGNVYGQSLTQKDLTLKKAQHTQMDTPLFKGGDDEPDSEGLPTEDEGDEFVTKPNPVKDELVFDFEFTVRTAIPYEVVDPLGRLAAQGNFVPGIRSQTIDFSKFKTGMYIVRLDLGDKVKVRRIIKN